MARCLAMLAALTFVMALSNTRGGVSGLVAPGEKKGALRKVVFVHRHCARTPMENTDNSCDEIGCGMCTEQGELMLKSTGESFRERYGSILPEKYLPKRGFISLSDSVIRCIQSSAAFLRGLFAFNSSYEVFTATESTGTDIIDPWNGQPGYNLHWNTIQPMIDQTYLTNFSQYWKSNETVYEMAAEVNFNMTSCHMDITNCLQQISDFVFSMRAQGKLAQFPICQANIENFINYRNWASMIWMYGYDYFVAKDGYFDRAGWPAHALLDAVLSSAESFNDANKDGDGTHEVFMHEFSGHDTTLMPLFSTMGNYSWVYPEFATSMVFEVYNNSYDPQDVADPYVVVKTTLPGQLPGSHPIQWLEYEVTCMNAENQLYTSTDGCPLSDLKRFAATRRGSAKRQMVGPCYAEYSDLVAQNCTDITGVKPTNKYCIDYRMACPLNGCGKGAYMREDYSCMSI